MPEVKALAQLRATPVPPNSDLTAELPPELLSLHIPDLSDPAIPQSLVASRVTTKNLLVPPSSSPRITPLITPHPSMRSPQF
jgi:hypothetical protein